MAGELLTRDMQIQWAGLLLGDGTDYSVEQLQGWDDLPSLDSGTVLRPQQHGAYAGRLLAKSRILVLDLTLTCAPENFPAVRRALLAASALAQDEQPLAVQLAGEQQMVNARIIARAIPTAVAFAQGNPHVTLTWEATDPRRYGMTVGTGTTGLPAPEAGLDWGSPEAGLDWGTPTETGLVWGTPGPSGDIACTNDGDADVHPVIGIRGPCTTPSITTSMGAVLEYGLRLAAGEVLLIDCWAGTVTLSGQSRLATATARSVPEGSVVIPAGTQTVVSFRSADTVPDPSAQATVWWRSAYW
ncbi:phage tail protein [Kitasatospora cineracea]|uniref:phage tail protein n=1 Tax=Kitasatospora cineracea TaxID=88074 RepID=UPI003440A501